MSPEPGACSLHGFRAVASNPAGATTVEWVGYGMALGMPHKPEHRRRTDGARASQQRGHLLSSLIHLVVNTSVTGRSGYYI